MKMLSIYKRIFSLSLCALLFIACATPAFAADTDSEGVLDPAVMQQMVEDFIAERGIKPENFSIGYVYTETGEEWYYNGDTWYYPASMYKVPLMMQLAEKVAAGELTQDSDLGGYTVATAEEYIITYSNNDYAHYVRKYLGGDEVWRQAAKGYAQLADGEYDPDYMDYCYFSPRYITQVVKTLYSEPERFPNIIECMKAAEPTGHYRLSESMRAQYDIAQKYGSYVDSFGDNFNHNTGIIYTPQPFILTVMTLNVSGYEKVISDAAVMFTDYTLTLEQELEEYVEEQEQQAEAERVAAEQAEAEAKAEAERIEQEKSEAIALAEAESRAEARHQKLILTGAVAAVVLLLVIVLIVLIAKRRKRKRYEEYERRFREEMAQRQRRGRY